jgi:PTS system beta-glucosides-specific IIC component
MEVIKEDKNTKFSFNKLMDIISGIFIPIINVLMAAAVLKGILMILISTGMLSEADGIYRILYTLADSFFYYLPVFLAYTAAKKIGADHFTAILIALALLHPNIMEAFESGAGLEIFGLPVKQVTYASSVIPILLAIILLHFVEKPLDRYLPGAIKGFLKPLISIIIVTPITFLVFGPVGTIIGDALAHAYALLYNFSPMLAGVCLGFVWQPMVVIGLQWGMVPVIINNLAVYGMDTILPMLGPGVFAQAGAAAAVSIMAKDKKLKSIGISSSITAILGTTEPVLFSISVPYKTPMLAACISGAIGGGIVGHFQSRAVSLAFPSLITMVVYMGEGFTAFLVSCILSFIIAFGLMFVFRFKEKDILEEEVAK